MSFFLLMMMCPCVSILILCGLNWCLKIEEAAFTFDTDVLQFCCLGINFAFSSNVRKASSITSIEGGPAVVLFWAKAFYRADFHRCDQVLCWIFVKYAFVDFIPTAASVIVDWKVWSQRCLSRTLLFNEGKKTEHVIRAYHVIKYFLVKTKKKTYGSLARGFLLLFLLGIFFLGEVGRVCQD